VVKLYVYGTDWEPVLKLSDVDIDHYQKKITLSERDHKFIRKAFVNFAKAQDILWTKLKKAKGW